MTSTRINNDRARTENRLESSTNPGRYMLDVPGNGPTPSYVEDPYVRLQLWGANRMTNVCDVESQLFGITQPLGKCNGVKPIEDTTRIAYPVASRSFCTEQPRATQPAWTVRDIEMFLDKDVLVFDPQENCALAFQNNISTRILEKDYFTTL